MDVFLFAFRSVAPILLLILTGYALARIGLLSGAFIDAGNKLVFRVCLPCMLFTSVYSIEDLSDVNWPAAIYAELVILLAFGLGVLSARWVPEPEQKGVLVQCWFRSNFAIIGLPLSAALGGAEGQAVAAVISAFSIPTFNILGVLALTMYSGRGRPRLRETLKKIVTNPLILGVCAGLLALCVRRLIPADEPGAPLFSLRGSMPSVYKALQYLSSMTTPLSLMVLGGAFDFRAAGRSRRALVLGTAARLVIVPVLGLGGAVLLSRYTPLLSLDKTAYPALVALFGAPAAVSSAIMARQMGGDGELAGQLVVWTSLFSALTIFLLAAALRAGGLL